MTAPVYRGPLRPLHVGRDFTSPNGVLVINPDGTVRYKLLRVTGIDPPWKWLLTDQGVVREPVGAVLWTPGVVPRRGRERRRYTPDLPVIPSTLEVHSVARKGKRKGPVPPTLTVAEYVQAATPPRRPPPNQQPRKPPPKRRKSVRRAEDGYEIPVLPTEHTRVHYDVEWHSTMVLVSTTYRNRLRVIEAHQRGAWCYLCGRTLIRADDLPMRAPRYRRPLDWPTIEHLVPVSRGGAKRKVANLLLACEPCNSAKEDWLLSELGRECCANVGAACEHRTPPHLTE